MSVYNGGVQILLNGGFETSTLSPGWVVTAPNGACSSSGATISSASPNTGTYSLKDGCVGVANQISQSFAVTTGQTYIVNFWLYAGGTSSVISASVTLS